MERVKRVYVSVPRDHNLDERDTQGVNKTNQGAWLNKLVESAGNRNVISLNHHGVVEASTSGLAGSPESLDPVTQIRASSHQLLGPVQQGGHSAPSRRTRNRSQPSLVGALILSRDHAPGPRDEPLDER